MKAKEVRRLMSDIRRWEEERKCVKTKRDNVKVTKNPYAMYVKIGAIYFNHCKTIMLAN